MAQAVMFGWKCPCGRLNFILLGELLCVYCWLHKDYCIQEFVLCFLFLICFYFNFLSLFFHAYIFQKHCLHCLVSFLPQRVLESPSPLQGPCNIICAIVLGNPCSSFFYVSSLILYAQLLAPSVVERVFIFILPIYRFYTASETHVGIRMVQTLAINLLTSIDPF